jgi:predicted HTH domain antitoxin
MLSFMTRVPREEETMGVVTLQIPDDLALALNIQGEELAPALLFAAAVKLFELGKISAGKAAELAGLPKPLFLMKLAELGVSASTLTAEDVTQDLANA